MNFTGWANAENDELVNAAARSSIRKRSWHSMKALRALDRGTPVLPLVVAPTPHFAKKYIKSFNSGYDNGLGWIIQNWYIDELIRIFGENESSPHLKFHNFGGLDMKFIELIDSVPDYKEFFTVEEMDRRSLELVKKRYPGKSKFRSGKITRRNPIYVLEIGSGKKNALLFGCRTLTNRLAQ